MTPTDPPPLSRRSVDCRGVLLAVVAAAMFGVVQFRPIRDVDMFWQVRTGDIILDTGTIPTTDTFSATHFGEPNPPIYWLSQLLYAGLLRVSGWWWLHALDSFCFAAALWLAARSGTSTVHPLCLLLAAAIGFVVAMPHHGLRPQTFGLLGFAAVMRIEARAVRTVVKAGLLVLVVILWQNLHASASVAVGYLGVKAAAALWRWWRGGDATFPVGAVLFPLLALGCLPLTPTGFDLFRISASNAALASQIGIEEWLPMWHPATLAASKFVWAAMGFTLLLLVANLRRVRADDLLLCVGLGVGAILVFRLSLFWCVAMIPVWARWLDAVRPSTLFAMPERRWPLVPSVAAALAAWTAAVAGPVLANAPLFNPTIPLNGVKHVANIELKGVVYNYREWGGPLLLAAHPNVRVTIDGRIYLYPREDWDAYLRAALGETPLAELEATFHPDAFFLRPSYHAKLIELIRASGRWVEEYRDDHCVLFLPRRGTPP